MRGGIKGHEKNTQNCVDRKVFLEYTLCVMTNISGNYSLTEMCARLNLSPSWVKKIEGLCGIQDWGSGQRGKKSFYNVKQYDFFRKVSNLRAAGFTLEDIKNLYDREVEIFDFARRYFPWYELDKEERKEKRRSYNITEDGDVIGFVSPYLVENLYCPCEGISFNRIEVQKGIKTKQKEAMQFQKMVEEFDKMRSEINRRYRQVREALGKDLKT